MAIEEHDEAVVRCPKMGDFVPFKYCRKAGAPFCWIIVKCWATRLDIGQFLADNYTPEQIHKGLERPRGGRVARMLEVSDKYRVE